MSKKNLLNETQVRQFMKLASLEPLSPGFVQGLSKTTSGRKGLKETHGRSANGDKDLGYGIDNTSPGRRVRAEGEEELESELDATEDELGAEDHTADEEAVEIDDMAAVSDEPVDADTATDTLSVADVVSAITAALAELTGQPVEASIDGADVDGAEDEMGAEAEMDMGMDAEVGMDDEVVDDLEVEDDEEMLEGKATDDLVEQITKRVAARILKAALSKK